MLQLHNTWRDVQLTQIIDLLIIIVYKYCYWFIIQLRPKLFNI